MQPLDSVAAPRAAGPGLGASLRLRLFGIDVEHARFSRRGFAADDCARRDRLEDVGRTFLVGYHAALGARTVDAVPAALAPVEPERRGFAFEGAAMALALLDLLVPTRRRVEEFLAGAGRDHVYMVHVGVGWALARLRRRAAPTRARLDPLLGWLAVDGYGFHEGYFRWPRYVAGRAEPPRRLAAYERRVFDQGLGRSLWFVCGAGVARVAAAVDAFPAERRPDLWSGVGLACAYAGAVGLAEMAALRSVAGPHAPMLAQGAAFAALARERAGNMAPHTELACEALCGRSAADAAAVARWAMTAASGPDGLSEPTYERVRVRIQRELDHQRHLS